MSAVSLPVEGRSIAAARARLHDVLDRRSCGPRSPSQVAATADAALMLSELVTNSVRHARTLLQVAIELRGRTLHVAVADDAPGPPVLTAPAAEAVHGRGLQIVNTLADDWGWTEAGTHKTTWFTLTIPR